MYHKQQRLVLIFHVSKHKVYALTHKISISEHLTELMNKSQRFTYNVTILLLVVKRTVMLKIGKSQRKKNIHLGDFFSLWVGWGSSQNHIALFWTMKLINVKLLKNLNEALSLTSSWREMFQVWEENNEFGLIPRKLVAQSWTRQAANGWTGRFGPKHKS